MKSEKRSAGKPGKTYNLTDPKEENGKTAWPRVGQVFVRDDGTGGAVFLTVGSEEKKYPFFPRRARDEQTDKVPAASPAQG